jgi:hypothetical protein
MRRLRLVDPGVDDLPVLLTVAEAAEVLRVSRSLAYELAKRYLESSGVEGLPVITLGTRRRVLRAALLELARTGCRKRAQEHRAADIAVGRQERSSPPRVEGSRRQPTEC